MATKQTAPGETAIAKRLADTHCPIDQTHRAGETPLPFAAWFGRLDMLPVLVAHSANPDHVDAREPVGATPNVDVTGTPCAARRRDARARTPPASFLREIDEETGHVVTFFLI